MLIVVYLAGGNRTRIVGVGVPQAIHLQHSEVLSRGIEPQPLVFQTSAHTSYASTARLDEACTDSLQTVERNTAMRIAARTRLMGFEPMISPVTGERLGPDLAKTAV